MSMTNPEEIGFPEKACLNVGTSLDIKGSNTRKHGTFTEDSYHACAFIIVVSTQNIAILY